jgi:hypothetical protein
VLFHGARADAQMPRNFLVAATLHQQIQHLLVTGSDFDFLQVDHGSLLKVGFVLAGT